MGWGGERERLRDREIERLRERERGYENKGLPNKTLILLIFGLLTLRCLCCYQDKIYPCGGRRKDTVLYLDFCLTHDKYQKITSF